MDTKTSFALFILAPLSVMLIFGGLAGCCPAPEAMPVVVTQIVEAEGEAVMVTVETESSVREMPAATAASADKEDAPAAGEVASADPGALTLPYHPNRLVIKNAELILLVEDADNAIDRTAQIASDTGGYILSSRVWYQDWLGESYKYATITLSVPSEQFESAMRRLRGLAVQVVDENASGQDVTDEYVDLQSRLENLTATRDRIRTFLDQAKTVEEALQINDELKLVEKEIELVQGRMNYLFDRAAYSTITVQLNPELPGATPTPTPTPTPEPEWRPEETVEHASGTLGTILKALAEIAIWLGIVVVPLVAPPLALMGLIVWIVHRWMRRRASKGGKPPAAP
jgi:hypothetical protein